MAGRKIDLKETVIEGFYTVKELLEQFVSDFQSRDRFFKYKVGIIAGWLGISAMTMVASCSGGPVENSLHAHTQVTQVLEDYSLLIKNDSSSSWKNVFVTINGAYTFGAPEVLAGSKLVVPVKQFVGPEGQIPPKDLKPRSLRIQCSEGTETIDLTKPQAEEP